LEASHQLQQIFREIEDEESWIREKEAAVSSTNWGRKLRAILKLFECSYFLCCTGKDLGGVQNLQKKHQALVVCAHADNFQSLFIFTVHPFRLRLLAMRQELRRFARMVKPW